MRIRTLPVSLIGILQLAGLSAREDMTRNHHGLDALPTDARHVVCDTCRIGVNAILEHVVSLQDLAKTNKGGRGQQIGEDRILNEVESICEPHLPAGQWLRRLSNIDEGGTKQSIRVVEMDLPRALCQRECKTAMIACERVFDPFIVELAEGLYRGDDRADLEALACSKVCRQEKYERSSDEMHGNSRHDREAAKKDTSGGLNKATPDESYGDVEVADAKTLGKQYRTEGSMPKFPDGDSGSGTARGRDGVSLWARLARTVGRMNQLIIEDMAQTESPSVVSSICAYILFRSVVWRVNSLILNVFRSAAAGQGNNDLGAQWVAAERKIELSMFHIVDGVIFLGGCLMIVRSIIARSCTCVGWLCSNCPTYGWIWPPDSWWAKEDLRSSVGGGDLLHLFYVAYFARYFGLLIMVPFGENHLEIFPVLLHHFFTLGAVAISHIYDFKRIGFLVMLLFEPADVPLHVAKVALNVSKLTDPASNLHMASKGFANFCYVTFALLYTTTRVCIAPALVLHLTFAVSSERDGNASRGCVAFLWAILVLNLYWFTLLVKSIKNTILAGGKIDDGEGDAVVDKRDAGRVEGKTKRE